LSNIISQTYSFASLVSSIKKYGGQYCFIYKDSASFNIIHDPLVLEKYIIVPPPIK